MKDTTVMTKYFHSSAYIRDKCHGPVIAATCGTRETEITREGDFSQLGAICLSCGRKPVDMTAARIVREFAPVKWAESQVRSARSFDRWSIAQSRGGAFIATSLERASIVEKLANIDACGRQCNGPDRGTGEAKALFQPNPRQAQL